MPYNSLDVNVLDWAENSLIDRVVSDSPAVNGMNCAFCDTSMKLGMQIELLVLMTFWYRGNADFFLVATKSSFSSNLPIKALSYKKVKI